MFTYGVMVMLGFVAALWWTVRSGRARGLNTDAVMDLGVWIFIPAMVGARLMYVTLNRADYANAVDVLKVWQGGMSFHGGLLGGVLGGIAFCRIRRFRAWDVADSVAPGIALGYAIGRVGCLLNGCCYGAPCHLPWALRFPDLEHTGLLTPPSHPAQIYSSLAGLAMFAALAVVDRKRRFAGQTFLWFLVLYCLYRFLIEFVRAGATARIALDGLTQAQCASIVIALGAMACLVWRGRAERNEACQPS